LDGWIKTCYHHGEIKMDLPTYHRPGFKKQLKAQDVTAKLVRSDILHKVPKNILFCIKHT
jgi:hypothetical protein